jgi:choline-sulfatase
LWEDRLSSRSADLKVHVSSSSSGIPRREFLRRTALGVAGLGLSSSRLFAIGQPRKQPNILLIMSDEHNPLISGPYGNKIVQTPNMDALAAKGVTFETHYCNSPLCVPSRASFTSGKYVSRVNVWGNTSELPSADIPSLPRVLNAAGYESFLCGKQHYDYTRRYGFTEVGGNFNNNFKTGLGNRRPPTAIAEKKISGRFKDFHPGDTNPVLEHDRKVTAGAVNFLSKRQAGDKPFFLFTGFLAPHFPLVVPEEYYQRYKGRIDMPDIPAGLLDSLPLNYQLLRAGFGEIGLSDETIQTGRELYYGMTDWIDGEIGKVIAPLRTNKDLADNTVIIYCSDHGENMGEHGMWWKNCMYDSATRVPLIVSWPERWAAGQRRSGASSHLDLVKTLVDIGGGHAPDDWNGDSMLPRLDDPKQSWKDYAVSEYYAHNIGSGYVMARSGPWKYTYHSVIDADHPAQRQLFNLTDDPHELTNLADRPEHAQRIAEMHQRMVAEIGGEPDATEQRARIQLAQGYHRTDKKPPGNNVDQG